jgi:hypothetical protein
LTGTILRGFDENGWARLRSAFDPSDMAEAMWRALGEHGIWPDDRTTWEQSSGEPLGGSGLPSLASQERLTRYQWFREIWQPTDRESRLQTLMDEGAEVRSVQVRVVELTGAPGATVRADRRKHAKRRQLDEPPAVPIEPVDHLARGAVADDGVHTPKLILARQGTTGTERAHRTQGTSRALSRLPSFWRVGDG